METICAALLAAHFGGAKLADVDRTRYYDVPESVMSQMTIAQRLTAKTCAVRFGIKYRVVSPLAAQPVQAN